MSIRDWKENRSGEVVTPRPASPSSSPEPICVICGKVTTEVRRMVEGQFEDVHEACLNIGREPLSLRSSSPSPEMSRFRKKPVVIEAVQYTGEGNVKGEVPTWLWEAFENGTAVNRDGFFYLATLEGDMRVMPSDWIIRGVKGELYPCKPDIFALTYEPAAPIQESDTRKDYERLLKMMGIECDEYERWFVEAEPGPIECDSLEEAVDVFSRLAYNDALHEIERRYPAKDIPIRFSSEPRAIRRWQIDAEYFGSQPPTLREAIDAAIASTQEKSRNG